MWGVRCRAEPMRLCRSCDVLRGGCCVCSAEGKSVFGRKRGRFGVAAVVPCEVSVRHRCDESSEEFRYVGFLPSFRLRPDVRHVPASEAFRALHDTADGTG